MGTASVSHTVLILGGGVGGVVAARPAASSFGASLPWLVAGRRWTKAISRPLRQLLKSGVELVIGDIDEIDPLSRSVVVDGRRLAGEDLIIALGASLAPERIPGLAEAGFNFYQPEGAEALRQEMARFRGGRL